MIRHARLLNRWARVAGLGFAVRWHLQTIRKRLGLPEPETLRVRPKRLKHALTLRLRGSSDIAVFNQIFVEEEYICLRDLRDVAVIIDLGANVGFSSAYFLNRFPSAKVLALEPDPRNVIRCKQNLAAYSERAVVLHGAIWSRRTRLSLSSGDFGDGREWATQVREPDGIETPDHVDAWDVPGLIDLAGVGTIDLLKIDIERSELAVFGDSSKVWLPKIRNICIELHGEDCDRVFFGALKEFDYDLSRSGELTICRNLRLRKPALHADCQ